MDKIRIRFHPGMYIRDNIEALEMTNEEFATATGIPIDTLNNIISEKESITYPVAEKLSNYFKTSITLWLNLQKSYDEYLAEKATLKSRKTNRNA